MYEFCDKEIRKKFKKTEYGKKTNRWFYISLGILGTIIFLAVAFCVLLYFELISLSAQSLIMLTAVFSGLFSISIIISCYFDGKRDGAIEQFKSTQEK